MDEGKPLVAVVSLSVSYGALRVLKDVSLTIGRGEIVGLLGPNGHGKTTLMRTISGLVRSDSGRIEFDGRDIGKLSANRRRLIGIGHVPQGDLLFSDLSVEENLDAGAYSAWRERNNRKHEIFGLFPELASRRTSRAATLSGGERRMLAISRAIMAPVNVLLIDEPSTGLAPSAIARVYDTIRLLNEKGGTVLLVEENLEKLVGCAHRVYLVDHGQIVVETTPEVLVKDQRLQRTYFGGTLD
jgi:branched-chain amino acid transport system ATP-binding protein